MSPTFKRITRDIIAMALFVAAVAGTGLAMMP